MYHHSSDNKNYMQYQRTEKRHRGSFLGTLLIIIGILWLLNEMGWHIGMMGWNALGHVVTSFVNFFQVSGWAVTFPVIILIAGVLLIAGRRLVGALLLLIFVLFFFPLILPGILLVILFPVLLVIAGVILITRIL